MEKNTEKKNRKKQSSIAFAVIAGVLSLAAIVAACTIFFRVDTIEVAGTQRYSEQEVVEASGVIRGSNLILTSKDQVSQRLRKKLAYVGSVEVKKRFPTTLKLTVTDTVAAAVVTSGDTLWLIDPYGKVLEEAQAGADYGCLTVVGLDLLAPVPAKQAEVLDENGGQLTGLISLMTALQNQGMLGQITEIDADSKTEISMLYQGRLKVKFLLGADYERKIRIFREIAALLGDYETGTVDLKTERGCFTPTL